jgi:competence protein ComEC
LPHHGSRGSSSAPFLEAVAPRLAIASAPCRGRFGMPHPEVRARLAERAVPLAWTGRDGALVVALRGPPAARGTGEPARCP